jgi:hypothetical protein
MRRVIRLLRLVCVPVIALAALTGGVARALEAQAAAHCARHPAGAGRAQADHGHAVRGHAHGGSAPAAALATGQAVFTSAARVTPAAHAMTPSAQPGEPDGECPHCPASACASATICIGGPAALAASQCRGLPLHAADDGLHVVAMREPVSPTFTPPTPPPNALD